jgi:hypothetical protein
MRGRSCLVLLGLLLLVACAPERAYEPPTITAAVIRRRPEAAPPPPRTVQPPPPPQIQRPPPETSTAAATATVLGAALGLPIFLVPPTPETVTLSQALPPVPVSGQLPGTVEVVSTLQSVGGVAIRTTGPVGPLPRSFTIWWLVPFLPLGLWNAGDTTPK